MIIFAFLAVVYAINPDLKKCKKDRWIELKSKSFLFFKTEKKGRAIKGNAYGCEIQFQSGGEYETKIYPWSSIVSLSVLKPKEAQKLLDMLFAWYDDDGPKKLARKREIARRNMERRDEESGSSGGLRPSFGLSMGMGTSSYTGMPHTGMNPMTGLPYRPMGRHYMPGGINPMTGMPYSPYPSSGSSSWTSTAFRFGVGAGGRNRP